VQHLCTFCPAFQVELRYESAPCRLLSDTDGPKCCFRFIASLFASVHADRSRWGRVDHDVVDMVRAACGRYGVHDVDASAMQPPFTSRCLTVQMVKPRGFASYPLA
jgi:hypothetical protein